MNLQTSEWAIQSNKTKHFYQDQGKCHYCRLFQEGMDITIERAKWMMKLTDTVRLLDTSNGDALTPMASSDSDSGFPCKSLPIEEEAESLSSEDLTQCSMADSGTLTQEQEHSKRDNGTPARLRPLFWDAVD